MSESVIYVRFLRYTSSVTRGRTDRMSEGYAWYSCYLYQLNILRSYRGDVYNKLEKIKCETGVQILKASNKSRLRRCWQPAFFFAFPLADGGTVTSFLGMKPRTTSYHLFTLISQKMGCMSAAKMCLSMFEWTRDSPVDTALCWTVCRRIRG